MYSWRLLVAVLAIACVSLVIPIAMRLSINRFIVHSVDDVPRSDAALVLGASVARGAPLPLLARRADTAIAIYKAGKVDKILVTGDNGALSHDEVTPVRKYLLAAGIPADDIFLDHAGFDTYSSIYRARDVFEVRSLVIVTQDFHVTRALWIARRLGLDARGISAGGGETLASRLREIPASLKALIDTITRRSPKYLGPVIPISGDGQVTWY